MASGLRGATASKCDHGPAGRPQPLETSSPQRAGAEHQGNCERVCSRNPVAHRWHRLVRCAIAATQTRHCEKQAGSTANATRRSRLSSVSGAAVCRPAGRWPRPAQRGPPGPMPDQPTPRNAGGRFRPGTRSARVHHLEGESPRAGLLRAQQEDPASDRHHARLARCARSVAGGKRAQTDRSALHWEDQTRNEARLTIFPFTSRAPDEHHQLSGPGVTRAHIRIAAAPQSRAEMRTRPTRPPGYPDWVYGR
jgi:hypothetical protein